MPLCYPLYIMLQNTNQTSTNQMITKQTNTKQNNYKINEKIVMKK